MPDEEVVALSRKFAMTPRSPEGHSARSRPSRGLLFVAPQFGAFSRPSRLDLACQLFTHALLVGGGCFATLLFFCYWHWLLVYLAPTDTRASLHLHHFTELAYEPRSADEFSPHYSRSFDSPRSCAHDIHFLSTFTTERRILNLRKHLRPMRSTSP